MKQFLDFLEIRNEWDDIDVKEHRDISVKIVKVEVIKLVLKHVGTFVDQSESRFQISSIRIR